LLLRPLVPDHHGHPQHGRLPHDLPGLARARRRDRRRAVQLRRQLGVRGEAHGPRPPRRVRRGWRGALPPPGAPGRRGRAGPRGGEYGGVAEVFSTLGGRWAPAAFTFLAMSWHPEALPGAGWLVIAGIAVLAVAGIHPSVRLAERFLEREGIVEGEVRIDD